MKYAQAVGVPLRDRIASLLREQRHREQPLRVSSTTHLPIFWFGLDRFYARRLSSLIERLEERAEKEGASEEDSEEALLLGARAKNYAEAIVRGSQPLGLGQGPCAVGDVARERTAFQERSLALRSPLGVSSLELSVFACGLCFRRSLRYG